MKTAVEEQPLLAKMWVSDVDLRGLRANSSQVYPLRCLVCHQINPRRLSAAVKSPHSCVVCSGKKVVPGVNDLSSHPLASELSPRNTVDATAITRKSEVEVLWRCPEGHDYTMAVASRLRMGYNCPYCSQQRTLFGYNDVLTTRPQLRPYLHPESIEAAKKLTAGSNTKLKWRCPKGHEYLRSPNTQWDRKNDRMRLCPACLRVRNSYGEDALGEWLASEGITIMRNDRRLISPRELDILIPDRRVAIEFNGVYWHSDSVIEAKYSMSAEEYHQIKASQCSDLGWKLIFVWGDDWSSRREEVQRAISRLLETGEPDSILTTLSKG